MNRLIGAATAVALGTSLLVAGHSAPANAEVIYKCGDEKNFYSGVNSVVLYDNFSCMGSNHDTDIWLFRDSHGDAQPGYMGGRSRTYFAGGTRCDYSVERWNLNPASSLRVGYENNCAGTAYALGYNKTWAGNDYNIDPSYKSPYMTIG